MSKKYRQWRNLLNAKLKSQVDQFTVKSFQEVIGFPLSLERLDPVLNICPYEARFRKFAAKMGIPETWGST